MAVLRATLPVVMTPGRGPNGPGPIDARHPVTTVGSGSVPYGPTNGYATPNGVTGFIGPAAGSLAQSTTWYVRVTGSNLNGGTSVGTAADRTGTDGVTTNGSLTFSSASASFVPGDVGSGICIQTATTIFAKITSIINSTSVILSNPATSTEAAVPWSIGGAWATPEPLLNCNAYSNATCGVQSGDTVYIGAGTYRAIYTLGVNFGRTWQAVGSLILSANANYNGQVNIVGDVTGQFTGDVGMVQLTAYTTNDKTIPSNVLVTMTGKSNLAFNNIAFTGGATTVFTSVVTSQNISFQDCSVITGSLGGGGNLMNITSAYATPLNWLFDRCIFFNERSTQGSCFFVNATGSATGPADYDVNVRLLNSVFYALSSVSPAVGITSGALARLAGGIKIRNCTFMGGGGLQTVVSAVSLVFPCTVYNSFIRGGNSGSALNAGTLGQIIEDYNVLVAGSPRTNVTAGVHSVADGSYAPLFHFGQERIWGGLLRPFGEPMVGSPLLGFGNNGSQTSYDQGNRPRPAGGGSPLPGVGAFERGNTATQATSPVPPQGTNVWQFTGPGFQDLLLPVSNTTTGFSISIQRDVNYAASPGNVGPGFQILANGVLGVAGQTIIDTGPSAQWNTLTSTNFTPSGVGWITVRLISYDGTGISVVSFADITVT